MGQHFQLRWGHIPEGLGSITKDSSWELCGWDTPPGGSSGNGNQSVTRGELQGSVAEDKTECPGPRGLEPLPAGCVGLRKRLRLSERARQGLARLDQGFAVGQGLPAQREGRISVTSLECTKHGVNTRSGNRR